MRLVKSESVGLSSARLQRITEAMSARIERGELPGVITAAARHGAIAHFACQGMADVAANRLMQPDTILTMYAMTEPITAVALMILYEEGRFLLSDPLSRFIPAFAHLQVLEAGPEGRRLVPMQREPAIQDLLRHTAGLGCGLFGGDSPAEELYAQANLFGRGITPEDFVAELLKLPLAHQPGSTWRYSVAADVVGYLVQEISGRPLGDFLRHRLFEPLQMADTGFGPPADRNRLATLYTPGEKGGLRPYEIPSTGALAAPLSVASGGGGLLSTAGDYLRFCQMLLDGGELEESRILSRKTIELMAANHLPAALLPLRAGPRVLDGWGFGLGLAVLMDVARSQAPGSVGAYHGAGAANTAFWIDPHEDLVCLYLPQLMLGPRSTAEGFEALVYQAIAD